MRAALSRLSSAACATLPATPRPPAVAPALRYPPAPPRARQRHAPPRPAAPRAAPHAPAPPRAGVRGLHALWRSPALRWGSGAGVREWGKWAHRCTCMNLARKLCPPCPSLTTDACLWNVHQCQGPVGVLRRRAIPWEQANILGAGGQQRSPSRPRRGGRGGGQSGKGDLEFLASGEEGSAEERFSISESVLEPLWKSTITGGRRVGESAVRVLCGSFSCSRYRAGLSARWAGRVSTRNSCKVRLGWRRGRGEVA